MEKLGYQRKVKKLEEELGKLREKKKCAGNEDPEETRRLSRRIDEIEKLLKKIGKGLIDKKRA